MPQVLVRQYGTQIEPNFVHAETIWPKFPTVERLSLQKTSHYSFSPFLENEGTISGTYNVINTYSKKNWDMTAKRILRSYCT